MIRLFFFVIVITMVVGVIYLLRLLAQPSNSMHCSRCDGRGFWYDARGKEICNWCKGSGRLHKS
jgi:DnaJ-class molecular chaperone